MQITPKNQITIEELVTRLESKCENVKLRKPWIGGNYISLKENNLNYRIAIRKKNSVINFDAVMPPIWYIVAILTGLVLFSVMFSLIAGQVVIVKGGGLVMVLIIFGAQAIYRSSKSADISEFAQKLQAIVDKESGFSDPLKAFVSV